MQSQVSMTLHSLVILIRISISVCVRLFYHNNKEGGQVLQLHIGRRLFLETISKGPQNEQNKMTKTRKIHAADQINFRFKFKFIREGYVNTAGNQLEALQLFFLHYFLYRMPETLAN